MRLGVREALVDGTIVPGDVAVEGGVIAAVGMTPAGSAGVAVPGFVDLQVNGFAGIDFAAADLDGYEEAGRAMAATGVTSYQPTFICLPATAYGPALGTAARARQSLAGPRLLGVHLEGPFLSPDRCGAHDPDNIVAPDVDLAGRLLGLGPVSHVTLAPELPGALEVVDYLVARSVTVACGHSDADAAAAHAAFDRGTRAVTHLFNALRPWRHGDPGVAGAALSRDDVVVTVILDGHHLAAETAEIIRRCTPGRMALITDAIAAAGRPDGTYDLGDRRVSVADGVATLADGTLAGSVLTMDRAVRNLVALGSDPVDAVAAATSVPAGLVGRPELGSLAPGTTADVTVLDDSLRVTRTLIGGVEHFAA